MLRPAARRGLLLLGLIAAYGGFRLRQRGVGRGLVAEAPPEPAGPTALAPEAAAPVAMTPEPIAPVATTPEPVAPIATTPEPVAPTATTPEPVAPTATTPEPVAPTATTPEPVAPTATTPEPVAPTAMPPEPVAPSVVPPPSSPSASGMGAGILTPELEPPRESSRIALLTRFLRPVHPGMPALVAFAAAAIALGVAGYFHGHLYHEGYRQVAVVGPLFFLNVIGTAIVILLLIAGRVLAFVGGALSIGLGAIVSILISHGSSFFGFAESGYQTTAVIILIAEALAVALTLVGLALGRHRLLSSLAGGRVA